MSITPAKLEALAKRLESLGVRDADLDESFILGGGSGGQKVNKSATCVQLHHKPSGIRVTSQKTRSREDNRFFARRLLCERLEALQLGSKSPQAQKIDKIRKQKKRRKRRQTPSS